MEVDINRPSSENPFRRQNTELNRQNNNLTQLSVQELKSQLLILLNLPNQDENTNKKLFFLTKELNKKLSLLINIQNNLTNHNDNDNDNSTNLNQQMEKIDKIINEKKLNDVETSYSGLKIFKNNDQILDINDPDVYIATNYASLKALLRSFPPNDNSASIIKIKENIEKLKEKMEQKNITIEGGKTRKQNNKLKCKKSKKYKSKRNKSRKYK
jgi:hypothetical protein